VLDHVVPNRHVLNLMVGLLKPRPVPFVTLAPTLEVAAARAEAEQVDYPFADRNHHQVGSADARCPSDLMAPVEGRVISTRDHPS
jgi:hypothetical protein